MTTDVAFLGEFGDAIDYIFHSHESQAGGARVGGSENCCRCCGRTSR